MHAMHDKRSLRAWCAWYTCMCGVRACHACMACVHGVSAIRACVRAYVWDVREWVPACMMGMRVCFIIIFNFNAALTFKSACTARSHWLLHTHTHAGTQKICSPEPAVPRENTVITGISKLKGWLILQVRYLGCKSLKLKKFYGVFKSIDSSLGHSDNVFLMFHVSFPNRVVSSHFLRVRKLKKKCCESAYS